MIDLVDEITEGGPLSGSEGTRERRVRDDLLRLDFKLRRHISRSRRYETLEISLQDSMKIHADRGRRAPERLTGIVFLVDGLMLRGVFTSRVDDQVSDALHRDIQLQELGWG